MRTAEEVLRKNSPFGIVNVQDWQYKAMKEYAIEVAKEALKNASENFDDCLNCYEGGNYCDNYSHKQSILSETNIPDLK